MLAPFDPVDPIEGDPDELRRQLERELESRPKITGRTWTLQELEAEFEVLAHAKPIVAVRRRSDGCKGSLLTARGLYWGFEPMAPDN